MCKCLEKSELISWLWLFGNIIWYIIHIFFFSHFILLLLSGVTLVMFYLNCMTVILWVNWLMFWCSSYILLYNLTVYSILIITFVLCFWHECLRIISSFERFVCFVVKLSIEVQISHLHFKQKCANNFKNGSVFSNSIQQNLLFLTNC